MSLNFLWISLGFFLLASVLSKQYRPQRMILGSIGWMVFAVYWALQPFHYYKEGDYSMVLLMLFAAFMCIIIAHLMFNTYIGIGEKNGTLQENPIDRPKTLLSVTTITAVSCLFYFPFAQIRPLNQLIISTVTTHTFWLSQLAGFPVVRLDWNLILLNNSSVEIILACTAIESIALFIGLILGVKAESKRIFKALMVSIPVIYILNLIRNTFVIGAYGYKWFGSGPMVINVFGKEYFLHDSASFYLGHHILAKGGSGIALFLIAYAVLKILPELLDLIDNLWLLIKEDIQLLFRSG